MIVQRYSHLLQWLHLNESCDDMSKERTTESIMQQALQEVGALLASGTHAEFDELAQIVRRYRHFAHVMKAEELGPHTD